MQQQHSGHHVLQWDPNKKYSEIERYTYYLGVHMFTKLQL